MMTSQQKTCLDAIRRLSRDGVSPTYDEIGAEIGRSKTAVHHMVQALKACGAIRVKLGRWRGIEVVDGLRNELERLVAAHGAAAVRAELDGVGEVASR